MTLIESPISWDQYFMTLAYFVAMKSKDPSTKVGAVIVGLDKEICSTGYNGLPRGVPDHEEFYQNKNYKYMVGNHAEENAIINAGRNGTSVKGCTIYCPWMPCASCARLIIQSGISNVVYHNKFPGNNNHCSSHWQDSIDVSTTIMKQAGILMRAYNGDIASLNVIYMGKKWDM